MLVPVLPGVESGGGGARDSARDVRPEDGSRVIRSGGRASRSLSDSRSQVVREGRPDVGAPLVLEDSPHYRTQGNSGTRLRWRSGSGSGNGASAGAAR